MDKRRRPKEIGIICVSFCAVHERPEAINLDEAERAQDRIEADAQVEEVERQQAQAVDVERRRVHVVLPQLCRVGLQHAVLQIAGAEVKKDVDQVEKVGEVVEAKPHQQRLAVDLLERKAIDDDPEVVEKGQRHDHRPIIAETAGGIEHKRPFC